MCKLMEDRLKEQEIITKKMEDCQIALNLLNLKELSYEKISIVTGLTLEEVQELATENNIAAI